MSARSGLEEVSNETHAPVGATFGRPFGSIDNRRTTPSPTIGEGWGGVSNCQ